MDKVDINFIEFQKDLGIDYVSLKEFYLMFAEELSLKKTSVNLHVQKNEINEASKIVHEIKGIAANFRVKKVYEISKELELQLKSNYRIKINYYVQAFNEVIDETIIFINAFFTE